MAFLAVASQHIV